MRRRVVAVWLLMPAGLASADPPEAASLAQDCVACHRAGGGEAIPALAGLPEEEFTAAMLAYRSGERADALMQVMAARLDDAEIAALARYFAGQGG